MAEIIPAIIGENFTEVQDKINKVKDFSEWVQIDVVDGRFAEPKSWGSDIGNNLHLWEPVELPKIEVHLMIERPSAWIDDWYSTSVDRILIHHESEGDKEKLIKRVKNMNTEVGAVLKFETPIDVLDEYIESLDVVQLMSISTIGSYGAKFEEGIYDKIKEFRKRYKKITLEIDGGINLKNAKKLVEAGADNLVVGSALFEADNIKDTFEELKRIIN